MSVINSSLFPKCPGRVRVVHLTEESVLTKLDPDRGMGAPGGLTTIGDAVRGTT